MHKKLLISVAIVSSLALANPAFADSNVDTTIKVTGTVERVANVIEMVSDNKDVKKAAGTVGTVAGTVKDATEVGAVVGTGAAVAGASGSSIMSTMAAYGGGSVVGAPVAAGVAGFAAADLMNNHLYSNCQDQKACDAAQNGTYAGAAVGTTAAVGTLAAVGAGPAGLAAIGGAVGGGMAAGAVAVVAAPVVAAAAVGGLVYWMFSD